MSANALLAARLRVSSRARQELGWIPRWDLDRALRAIVHWHQGFAAGADMRTLSLQQIDEYETTSHHA